MFGVCMEFEKICYANCYRFCSFVVRLSTGSNVDWTILRSNLDRKKACSWKQERFDDQAGRNTFVVAARRKFCSTFRHCPIFSPTYCQGRAKWLWLDDSAGLLRKYCEIFRWRGPEWTLGKRHSSIIRRPQELYYKTVKEVQGTLSIGK